MPPRIEPPVVIVGAGLAGLTCGLDLVAAGVPVRILEGADAVGGRMRTDRQGGFLLDRGFQVFNTAYPQVKRRIDLRALQLRPFTPGMLLQAGDRRLRFADPTRQPAGLADLLRGRLGGPADMLALARLSAADMLLPVGLIKQQPDRTTLAALGEAGVSPELCELFFRPFLAGVFLEDELETSARFFHLVWRTMLRGTLCLPRHGIQAVPEQLAAALPAGTVQLETPVDALTDDGVGRPDGEAAVRPGAGAAAWLAGRLDRPVAAVPDWDGVVPLKTPVAAARATPTPPSAATTPSDRKPRCRASRDTPDLVRPGRAGCWPVPGDGASWAAVNAARARSSPASSPAEPGPAAAASNRATGSSGRAEPAADPSSNCSAASRSMGRDWLGLISCPSASTAGPVSLRRVSRSSLVIGSCLLQAGGEPPEPAVGRSPDRARLLAEDLAGAFRVQAHDDPQHDRFGLVRRKVRDHRHRGLGGDRVHGALGRIVAGRQVAQVLNRGGRRLRAASVATLVVQAAMPGDGGGPAAETVGVAAEPGQIPRDVQPGFRGHVFGVVADHGAQVAQQPRLHVPVEHAERLLIALLCRSHSVRQIGLVGPCRIGQRRVCRTVHSANDGASGTRGAETSADSPGRACPRPGLVSSSPW